MYFMYVLTVYVYMYIIIYIIYVMYTLIHIKSLFRGYKIYVDDTLVAVAEETQQGFQSITFRGVQEARVRFMTFRGDQRNEINGENHRKMVV